MSEVENIKYGDPPIVEVFCEVFVDSSYDLSLNNLIKLRNSFEIDYPKIQEGTIKQIPLSFNNSVYKNIESSKFVKFSNNNSFVELSSQVFKYSKYSPYEKWEIYKPKLIANFEKYREIIKSGRIKQIRLKYKNEIPLNKIKKIHKDIVEVDIGNYLNISIVVNPNYDPIARFIISLDTLYSKTELLNLKLANMANREGEDIFNISLDIEYIISMDNDNLPVDLLDQAHNRIKKAFEDSITDKCRELFEVKQNANS